MQPPVRATTSTAVRSVASQQRELADADDDRKKSLGTGGILLLLGLTVGVYALSPGAWYFYKHGCLPPARRRVR